MTTESHSAVLRTGEGLSPQPSGVGILGNRRVYKEGKLSAILLSIPPTCITLEYKQLSSYFAHRSYTHAHRLEHLQEPKSELVSRVDLDTP